ncbi:MAG TPA: ParA family protein [Novosphingobium sp.]|nr:ParA family protein [Novosphingobium sp.]
MGIVAVYSAKGGVGKTTIAVDLAWRMARAGRSTVLWDLDPQGGSAFLLGEDQPVLPRAASLFQREGSPRRQVRPTRWANLSLLHADDSLRTLPMQLARLGRRNRLASLGRELLNDHQRLVLDCPPHQNEVSEQVITAADLIVVPLPPSPLAARALDLLVRDIARIDRRHAPILPLISMYDPRRKAHREAREGTMARFPVIPQSSQIEQAAFRREPVGAFAGGSAAGQALGQVWRAVEGKLAERRATPAPAVAA